MVLHLIKCIQSHLQIIQIIQIIRLPSRIALCSYLKRIKIIPPHYL
nr:MAG TPA: hypothetical protein [Crassvirales sp.]